MNDRKGILLAGFGNMGQALAQGWIERGTAPSDIYVVDPDSRARAAARALGVKVVETAGQAPDIGIVLFAVKPQQLDDVLGDYSAVVNEGALVLSIVAGKRIDAYANVFGDSAAVVRVMPNTPAAIGQGVSVLVASAGVTGEQRRLAAGLMQAAGHVEWLEDESLMDAVTAVSGSGPAYVFLLIEAMASAGARAGLPADLAARLATHTVAGSGALAAGSDEAARELRRRVTSPGGTTQAALEVLCRSDALVTLLDEAVSAAVLRSRQLSGN